MRAQIDKLLKLQANFRKTWVEGMKKVHIWGFLVVTFCTVTPSFSEPLTLYHLEGDSSVTLLNPDPSLQASEIISDQYGIRTQDESRIHVSEQSTLDVLIEDSIQQKFSHDHFGQTLESKVLLELETQGEQESAWFTQVSSSFIRQDISRFTIERNFSQYPHRIYSLSQGWRKKLVQGLRVELFAGVAQCLDLGEDQAKLFPLGGMRLSHDVNRGSIYLSLGQEIHAQGSLSGVYGSQVYRSLRFAGNMPVIKGLSLHWGCGMAVAQTAFEKEQMLNQAPIISADIRLEYELSSSFKGSLGYGHRALWGAGNSVHGFEGPVATASVSYALF